MMKSQRNNLSVKSPALDWERAVRYLKKRDPILRVLIKRTGPHCLVCRTDPYITLARSIVGQQISVKAAQSIWCKIELAFPVLTPETIGNADSQLLRNCGLSARKVEYIKDLSDKFATDAIELAKWADMEDGALISHLIQIKGVGQWTAEMLLIFNQMRPDVLPLDDVGLQRAVALHYNRAQPLSRGALMEIGEQWRPWRSVATWYMWRSLELNTKTNSPL